MRMETRTTLIRYFINDISPSRPRRPAAVESVIRARLPRQPENGAAVRDPKRTQPIPGIECSEAQFPVYTVI